MKLKKLFGKILGAGLCMGMLLGCMPGGALQVKAATQPELSDLYGRGGWIDLVLVMGECK